MTLQSAVLLVASVVGLVVASVLSRTAARTVLPRSAKIISALAVPIWIVYFATRQGRFLLASQGFRSTMPDALWFGITFGVFTAAFFLAIGYVYGDAKRRDMPAGRCRPHTQSDWIHPLLSVPKASAGAVRFLWQAYREGSSLLLILRRRAELQRRTRGR